MISFNSKQEKFICESTADPSQDILQRLGGDERQKSAIHQAFGNMNYLCEEQLTSSLLRACREVMREQKRYP